MDSDNLGWLKSILGMQPKPDGGPSFGMLGGGLNGSGPSPALPPAASGGMPMSSLGPGAPAPGSPPLPGNGAPPMDLTPGAAQPGLLSMLAQKFGGGQQPGAAPNAGRTPAQNNMMQTAQNLIQGPQIQPTQWMPWMRRV